MYRVKHLFFQGLQGCAETVFNVPSCFAANGSYYLQLKGLDAFITRVENRADIAFLKHFYFKIQLPLSMRKYRVPFAVNGQVSPFDTCFKKMQNPFRSIGNLLLLSSLKSRGSIRLQSVQGEPTASCNSCPL